MTSPTIPINVLALTKQSTDERYILMYDDDQASEQAALSQLGRWAIDGELSFTWVDAAILSMKVHQKAK